MERGDEVKPQLHPATSDFKTTELFACEEGVGIRLLQGQQVVRFTPAQWDAVTSDAAAFLKEHAIRHAALN